MTIAELARRVEALESEMEQMRQRLEQPTESRRAWWREEAGRFANDPVFEEIVRLGQEYREAQRSVPRKTRTPGNDRS